MKSFTRIAATVLSLAFLVGISISPDSKLHWVLQNRGRSWARAPSADACERSRHCPPDKASDRRVLILRAVPAGCFMGHTTYSIYLRWHILRSRRGHGLSISDGRCILSPGW